MARRDLPEINASSLADIAFLLLTFFLVATTLNKPIGLYEKLPDPKDDTPKKELNVTQNNQLLITIDDQNVIRINDEVFKPEDLQDEIVAFLDNGLRCDFCQGKKDPKYSTHPASAAFVFKRTKNSTFSATYAVKGAVEGAYDYLRNRYAIENYNRSWRSIQEHMTKAARSSKFELDPEIQDMYKDINENIPVRFPPLPTPVESL